MEGVIIENKEQFDSLCDKEYPVQFRGGHLGDYDEYVRKCRTPFTPRRITDYRLVIEVDTGRGFGFCDAGYFIQNGYKIITYERYGNIMKPTQFLKRHTIFVT